MAKNIVKRLFGGIKKRRNRGTPKITSATVKDDGDVGDEKLGVVDISLRNNSDKTVRLIGAEIRSLNGTDVVPRGSIDEVTLKPGDHSKQKLEFTSEKDVFNDDNFVTVRVRATIGGKLYSSVETIGTQ